MVLFAELICSTCNSVLAYPVGAISCRCQHCYAVNPVQHMCIECPGCLHELLVPITTTEALCPVCTSIIEIPVEMLPIIPKPRVASVEAAPAVSKYVEGPLTLEENGRSEAPSVSIATQVA